MVNDSKLGPGVAILLAVLVVLPVPVAGQGQSPECRSNPQSIECLRKLRPCLQSIAGNVTHMANDILKSQIPKDLDDAFQAVTHGVGTVSAMKDLFKSLFAPLLETVKDATQSTMSGQPDEVVSASLVGFLKILLELVTNKSLRTDPTTVKMVETVQPGLQNINRSLQCATRTMGGLKSLPFIQIEYFSSIVLFYLGKCFDVEDQTPWCTVLDTAIPLSMKVVMKLVPIMTEMVSPI